MKRIALSFLVVVPWLGVACGNGDDNGSPVPSIPADATIDSMADVAVGADVLVVDQVTTDAQEVDAAHEAGDGAVAPDGELADGAHEGASMTDADAGE